MLTEELNPKMPLEVASQLFELYLTLADIQRFWSSIPGRWVSWPVPPAPSLHLFPSLTCFLPPRVLQLPLGGLWDRSPKALGRKLSWVPLWPGTLGHAGLGCLSWACSDWPPATGIAAPWPWLASTPRSCPP